MTAGELRKLIDGRPDDWVVPVSIAYGNDVVDNVFVRLDDVTAGKTKPAHPEGNIHDPGPAIFVTVSLVDGTDDERNQCDLCDDFFSDDEFVVVEDLEQGLCPDCLKEVEAYMKEWGMDVGNAVANMRVDAEADDEEEP